MSCSNPACEGGMVQVDPEGYGELAFPVPAEATEEQIKTVEFKRRHYSVAYRPCQDCRPEQFARWANGCLRSDHEAKSCELCLEALGEKEARAHDRAGGRR